MLSHPWPKQKVERVISSVNRRVQSAHARRPVDQHTPERPLLASLADRARIPSSAENTNKIRPTWRLGLEFLRSAGHRSTCALHMHSWSVRRAPGLGDGSDAELATRLTHGFEGELKVGLRVLTLGIGILGGWAIFVPLSGAVVVPGTLVVESDVKKIQHQRARHHDRTRQRHECRPAADNTDTHDQDAKSDFELALETMR